MLGYPIILVSSVCLGVLAFFVNEASQVVRVKKKKKKKPRPSTAAHGVAQQYREKA